ncbi:MAG: hypothetical protein RR595_13520 [Lysinibacillus sp.]
MKKFFTILSAGTLALMLAACNDTATPKKETTDESKLTLEQVYEKAIDRQSEIKSLSSDMKQNMVIDMAGESSKVEINADLKMDIVTEPLTMYLKSSTDISNLATNEKTSMPLEMYMIQEQGFYVKDFNSAGWMKLPNDNFDEIANQATGSADSKEQLKQLQQFVKDFKFEQTDDAYILTLNAEGEKFKKFMESQIAATLPDTLAPATLPLDAMTIEKANYVLTIDKKTFDTNKIDVDFDFNMTIEGEKASIVSKSIITYTSINNISEIKIPQNIIDTAIDASF